MIHMKLRIGNSACQGISIVLYLLVQIEVGQSRLFMFWKAFPAVLNMKTTLSDTLGPCLSCCQEMPPLPDTQEAATCLGHLLHELLGVRL